MSSQACSQGCARLLSVVFVCCSQQHCLLIEQCLDECAPLYITCQPSSAAARVYCCRVRPCTHSVLSCHASMLLHRASGQLHRKHGQALQSYACRVVLCSNHSKVSCSYRLVPMCRALHMISTGYDRLSACASYIWAGTAS